jgi:hypothetical protein
MSEELEQLLKNLKLRRVLEIYEEQLRAADKGDISDTEFLTRLVGAVASETGGCAGMAYPACQSTRALGIGDVSLRPATRRERKQIRGFAELEFIAKAENVVFCGKTDPATFCPSSPRY